MLTLGDIQNLTEYQKEVFVTKQDFGHGMEEIKQSFFKLQTSVDGITKDKVTREQEATVMAERMKNAESWIDEAAPKIGVDFKH